MIVCILPTQRLVVTTYDLEAKNTVLLGKWLLFKLLTEEGVWQEMLRSKYIGSKALSHIHWEPGDSHFWAGLMKVKRFLLSIWDFPIRDGSEVRFWEDSWLCNAPLKV